MAVAYRVVVTELAIGQSVLLQAYVFLEFANSQALRQLERHQYKLGWSQLPSIPLRCTLAVTLSSLGDRC
eukprot:5449154-Amphidinium_carterae.1